MVQVRLPSLLYERVIEAEERVQLLQGPLPPHKGEGIVQGLSGEWVEVITPLDLNKLRPKLQALLDEGIDSLAIVFLHSYTFPGHEEAAGQLAREMGFRQVSQSAALVPMVRMVPRGQTAVLDAYLTPAIQAYLRTFLEGFDAGLKDVTVLFMQSDGGLTPAESFSGFKVPISPIPTRPPSPPRSSSWPS